MACFMSCINDDTNYDYPSEEEVKAGELVIDTAGTNRNVFWKNWGQDSIIHYELNVKYPHPEDLEYAWIVVPYPYRAVAQGNTTVFPKADTLCTTKDLHFECHLEPGWHSIYFIAKDVKKGISQYQGFGNYITVASQGALPTMVYCLEEMPDGTVDIDMFGTEDALILNVGHEKRSYSQYQSANPIQGKPRFLAKGSKWFYIVTDEEVRRVSNMGWATMDLNEQLFYQAPERIHPEAILATNGCEWMINDGKLYCINNVSEADRTFPAPIPGDYHLFPVLTSETKTTWRPTEGAIDAHQIVFDDKAMAIRPYFAKASALSYFGLAESSNAFNYNKMNPEAEVVFVSGDMGDNETMVVTKEDDGYWANVACFFNVVDNGLLARRRVSMNGLKDFDKAEHMTVSTEGSAIYYSVGNKFYSWAYGSGRTEANAVYEFPASEQITALRVIYGGGFPSGGWAVWIATWDEQAKDGKVYEIFLDPISGDPGTVWGVFGHEDMRLVDNGFGKIIDMLVP